MLSTSSPTYPASVSTVASAIQKGTFKSLAMDFAINVFPVPVRPTIMIFDFSISISSSVVSGCINLL